MVLGEKGQRKILSVGCSQLSMYVQEKRLEANTSATSSKGRYLWIFFFQYLLNSLK